MTIERNESPWLAPRRMSGLRDLARAAYHNTAFRLGVLAFVVYNANLRSITSADTNPTRYLPISILKEWNLDLDEFDFLQEYPRGAPLKERRPAQYVQHVRGHYMSTYPVMPAILAVPVYAVPVALGLTEGGSDRGGLTRTEVVGTLLSKISASAYVALSVALVYLTLLRFADRRTALAIALLYAFATSSWSVSAQGLWQTAASQPMLALALYCLVRAREAPRVAAYAGIPLAISVASKPPTIMFAAVFTFYVLWRHRDQFVRFLIAPAIVGALLVAYNHYFFGNLMGGYEDLNTRSLFTLPRLANLAGLLVSPSRGMLVSSPVLVFALGGLGIALVRRRDALLSAIAVASLLFLLFYSSWQNWPGAFSFSYRHMVDLLPGLCLLLVPAYQWAMAVRWRKGAFVALTAGSVLAQVIGCFYYPCGWYATPVSANLDRRRYWDWSDPELLRCLRAGPVEPDGVVFIRGLLRGD
jgi:hypothetical protein